MSNYQCPRCLYTTENKPDYIRHLKRKNICKPIDENHDIDISLVLQEYSDDSQKSKLDAKISELEEKLAKIMSIISPTYELSNITYIHEKPLNFGNESYDHISFEFQKTCIDKGMGGIFDMIKQLHFCGDAPCNHNIRIKSCRRRTVDVYRNNKWTLSDANETIDEAFFFRKKQLYAFFMKNVENNKDMMQKNDLINEMFTKTMVKDRVYYGQRRNFFNNLFPRKEKNIAKPLILC